MLLFLAEALLPISIIFQRLSIGFHATFFRFRHALLFEAPLLSYFYASTLRHASSPRDDIYGELSLASTFRACL